MKEIKSVTANFIFFNLFAFLFLNFTFSVSTAEVRLENIKLPPGFSINVYANGIDGARSLALGPDGIVFAGSRSEGKVYALINRDSDHRAEETVVIANGLNSPNGVAYHNGSLYVAEISRILRFDDIAKKFNKSPEPAVIIDTFPKDTHHGWKYIRIGPDNKLYVPVGAPCNICLSNDPRYATIMRVNLNGSNPEIFARGIRNTVGFDWHPVTKELWFTDNGRDWLGNDVPPDELNCAPVKDMHFGFPFCHGVGIPDPEYGNKRSCSEFTPPRQTLGPHVAALGMKFYTGVMFPARYKNKIFIAEHGSWNRLTPIGYRITLVTIEDGKAAGYETFAHGWHSGFSAWGRPVDVLVMPDGALLVSDDRADAVYRISFIAPGTR